jgi:short-subunit dehydrogenase
MSRTFAVITGASTGIGRELALVCAGAGYDVVLIARNAQALETLAAEIGSNNGTVVRVLPADLSIAGAPGEILRTLQDILPDVEILINNAGFGLRGFFSTLDTARQMEMIQVNISALTHLTRLFLPSLLARGKGRILNVASTAAFQPGPLMTVYYATKAYVLSFSEALHNEVRDRGVTVTTLCPGPTATEFQERAGMSGTKLFGGGRVMDAKSVARIGFDAMMAGRPAVIAGRLNAFVAFMTRFVPRQFAANLARRLQERRGED